jgi:hypothetical protein
VSNKHNDICCHETVKFPMEPSSVIDGSELITIQDFDFIDGARFLRGDGMCDERRKDVLCILAPYVKHTGNNARHEDAKGSCENVYAAVPDVLVHLAEGSRFDSGFRLLERSCRHTLDEDSETSLLAAKGKVCEFKGETCLLINSCMKASMRDQCYDCTQADSAID